LLALAVLEQRVVPTTLSPSVFTDSNAQGVNSLRNAIIAANTDTGTATDTINLRAGTYTLGLKNSAANGHESASLTGDLNITSTAHELIIQGKGSTGPKKTVISAAGLADRVFQIVNAGTVVEFCDLVIAGGLAQDDGTDGATAGMTDALGGGVLNEGGTVTLVDVLLSGDRARAGVGNNALGGAICNIGGSVTMQRDALGASSLLSNSATGARGVNGAAGTMNLPTGLPATNGGNAQGGGLYTSGGTISASDVILSGNSAVGGNGGNGRRGSRNNPSGGAGGSGGVAQGGGLYSGGGTVSLTRDNFSSNHATAGRGGNGGNGFQGGTITIGSHGQGGFGAAAQGGGLYSGGGSVTLNFATVSSNLAVGGAAGFDGFGPGNAGPSGAARHGGNAQGGGLFVGGGSLSVTSSSVISNGARAGAGGDNHGVGGVDGGTGGSAQGGGIFSGGDSLSLTNSTIASNNARGAAGGNGGPGGSIPGPTPGMPSVLPGGSGGAGGSAQGGGLYASRGTITLGSDTVALNSLQAGQGGAGGSGKQPGQHGAAGSAQGGGIANGSATVGTQNALIARNTAASGTDYFGSVTSSDHDLVGDGSGSTGFSTTNGDKVGTDSAPIDPMLGALAVTAGNTATLVLLPGSPAIDAGDNNTSPGNTDQRALARIIDGTIDIGAVEYQCDLAVAIKPIPASVKAGGKITYIITVTNKGPDMAALIVVSDVISDKTTFVSLAVPSGWSKSVPSVGSGGTVTVSRPQLASSASAKFTLVVKVTAGTPTGTIISNSAAVGPAAFDLATSNNSAMQSTTVH
jgi:uncharacterized repeat protein (TIGR01451 family)